MAIILDAQRWANKHERRLAQQGIESNDAQSLRIVKGDLDYFKNRTYDLERRLRAAQDSCPRELRRKFQITEKLIATARQYMAQCLTINDPLLLKVEQLIKQFEDVR